MIDDTDPPRFTSRNSLWRPPQASLAHRKISKRSRASGRSTILSGDNREIRCESLLEKKIAMRLLTSKQVKKVVEQPPAVTYHDATGKRCLHFFDFLVTMNDDRKIAFAVRPEARAKKLRALFPLILAGAEHFADGFVLVTEKHAPQAAVANAALILSARRSSNTTHDQAIRTVIADLQGEVTIGDIVAISGLHGDGFRAVIRAIDRGELIVTTGGQLDYATRIARITTEGNA